jgi:Holliday junction resolvase
MSYVSGRRFEYRARDIFRKFGFQCDRKAASSPYDLLAQKHGKTFFLAECKKTGKKNKKCIYVSTEDVDKLVKESLQQNAIPLVIYGFNRTPAFVALPKEMKKSGKMYKLPSGENKLLEDFLKGFKHEQRKD